MFYLFCYFSSSFFQISVLILVFFFFFLFGVLTILKHDPHNDEFEKFQDLDGEQMSNMLINFLTLSICNL